MGLLAPLDKAIPELRVPNGLPQEVGSAVVAAWANSAEREGFEPSVPLRVRHAAALVDAGDIAAARALHEAIGRLLGDERAIRADVIDLNEKRRP
jgi:hypothetical protein